MTNILFLYIYTSTSCHFFVLYVWCCAMCWPMRKTTHFVDGRMTCLSTYTFRTTLSPWTHLSRRLLTPHQQKCLFVLGRLQDFLGSFLPPIPRVSGLARLNSNDQLWIMRSEACTMYYVIVLDCNTCVWFVFMYCCCVECDDFFPRLIDSDDNRKMRLCSLARA